MNSVIDSEEYQKSLRVRSFFSHPGWTDFEAEILDKYEYHNSQVVNACQHKINPSELDSINFHIAQRACYSMVLEMKERMLEEVGALSPEDEGVNKASMSMMEK